MRQHEILLQIFFLMELKEIWPDVPKSELVKTLLYLHGKGWLYATLDEEGDVDMFAAMYRIPEYSEKAVSTFPTEEKGKILYIPLFVSIAKDKKKSMLSLKKLTKDFDIDKIMFRERGKALRCFKKEGQNGAGKTETRHSDASIPRRPEVLART